MTLGERLLEYRTTLKISQDTLAEKLGVTRQTISKWETDQSTPEFNKILPLCEVFGITPDELIKGEKGITEQEEKSVKEEIQQNNYYNEYTMKRNKQKGITVSISVFLYIIGTFIPAIMDLAMGEGDTAQSIGFMVLLWAIATAMLIYFFLSHPKLEVPNQEKEIKSNREERNRNILEIRILQLIALLFLFAYLIISFTTWEWHITWILWIVLPIVELIVKIVFDLKRGERKNEE